MIEEKHSPPLLGSDGQGPHANHKNKRHHHQSHDRPFDDRERRDRWEPPHKRYDDRPRDRKRQRGNGHPRHNNRDW